jgi:small subunit ribosomal protein S16
MSLRIRLRRVGRKKQPSYRLVVADSQTPRDGAYVDTVGFYNPRRSPAELRIDLPKVEEWLTKGASLSTTAESLVKKARRGGDATVAVRNAVSGDNAEPAPAEGAAEETPAAE